MINNRFEPPDSRRTHWKGHDSGIFGAGGGRDEIVGWHHFVMGVGRRSKIWEFKEQEDLVYRSPWSCKGWTQQ